jgi:hypothetical protein
MEEKGILRHICKIHVSFFYAVSLAFDLKFAKSANMTQKIFSPNIFNMGIKKRRISNPLKK